MKNVIVKEQIEFIVGDTLMIIPEGSVIHVNFEDSSTIIADHYVTIFPDEYNVIN